MTRSILLIIARQNQRALASFMLTVQESVEDKERERDKVVQQLLTEAKRAEMLHRELQVLACLYMIDVNQVCF